MLAVSLMRVLPAQSYDNWINPTLILFLIIIIIISILVQLTMFLLQNIKSSNIIKHHLSTAQETSTIWQKPGGPAGLSPPQRK